MILLLEAKNHVTGEALRLTKEDEEETYFLLQGKYPPGVTDTAKWVLKVTCHNRDQAVYMFAGMVLGIMREENYARS